MRDPAVENDTEARLPRWRRRLRSRRFVVRDTSMAPTLLPGDRLWVDVRAFRHRPPRVGEVVVARDPEEPARLLVKRVSAVSAVGEGLAAATGSGGRVAAGFVRLRGDNPRESRDSRAFGPIEAEGLVGPVWFRYAPAPRRGPVPPPR